jgi:hypothetical protein
VIHSKRSKHFRHLVGLCLGNPAAAATLDAGDAASPSSKSAYNSGD